MSANRKRPKNQFHVFSTSALEDPRSISSEMQAAKPKYTFGPDIVYDFISNNHVNRTNRVNRIGSAKPLSFDNVLLLIKDPNVKNITQVVSQLNTTKIKLEELLQRNNTSYTQIKLDGVSDEELLDVLSKGSIQGAREKLASLGVHLNDLLEYMRTHRKEFYDLHFSDKEAQTSFAPIL